MRIVNLFPALTIALSLIAAPAALSQNVGIGTTNPQSQLHVNGDFRLKNGVAVTTISADSMFAQASDTALPTQKALQRYVQKGLWAPAQPNEVSIAFTDSSGTNVNNPRSLHVQGNYAYMVSLANNQLSVYDISDPGNIVPKGFTSANMSSPFSVFVLGNYAYVASYANNRLCIYDISDPNNIVAKGYTTNNLVSPSQVYVQGNYAYVLSASMERMCIFDITDPNNIVAKGITTANLSNPNQVYVNGNFAYVASLGSNKLCIYDVSDPNNILARGSTSTNLSLPRSVFVQGNFAYVVSRGNNSLCIYDVSNPDNILAKGLISTNLDLPTYVYVQGNFAYVASVLNNRVCAYDISDPNKILPVGFSNTNLNSPNCLFIQGNIAFVSSSLNNRLCSYKIDFSKRSLLMDENGSISFSSSAWTEDTSRNDLFRNKGNVGIGTATPTQKLDVIGTIRTTNFQITADAAANKILRSDATGNATWVDATTLTVNETDPKIGANTTNYLSKWNGAALVSSGVFDNGANVGIGTASPAQKLDVAGTTRTTNFQMTAGAAANRILQSDASGNASWVDASTLPFAETDPQVGANTTNYLSKWNGTSLVASTLIDNSGFVGIGTATPSMRLDVTGNSRFTGDVTVADSAMLNGNVKIEGNTLVAGNVGIGNTVPRAKLHITNIANPGAVYHPSARVIIENNNTNYLQFTNPTVSEAGILAGTELGGFRSAILFKADSSVNILAGANATPKVMVDNNGFTGINTVSPFSFLDVRGSIAANITSGNTNKTMGPNDFTHIITSALGQVIITLPAANTCPRRIYVIINFNAIQMPITSYINNAGNTVSFVPATQSVILQSDGVLWYKLN